MRTAIAAAAAAALAATAWPGDIARAQTYPSRSVTIVVPFAPGGATDVVARVLADQLSARLGQSVLVENRAGANGAIGSAAVAKAEPDGHTLVMGGVNTHAINDGVMKKPLYNSQTDFAPVALTSLIPIAIVVHASLGVETLADLVRMAKAQPGKLSYGSSGAGGPHHLAMEMFKLSAEIDVAHVPYRGGAPQLNDLVGGHIKIGAIGLPPVLQHVQAGTLKALAMVERTRSDLLPAVPTVAESGFPGFEVSYWMGVLAPARTPQPVVRTLHEAIAAVLARPEVRDGLRKQGVVTTVAGPEAFGTLIAAEVKRWGEVSRRIGLKID